MDTLISHAAGQNDMELCGVILNRGRIVMTLLFIPICLVSTQIERTLVMFKQDAEVASFAQQFVYAYLPGLYMNGLVVCQTKFLNNLGKTFVPMTSTFIAVALHPIWS